MNRRLQETRYHDVDEAHSFFIASEIWTGSSSLGIRSECKTNLLNSLLSELPHISELTLSIAHQDLRPELLWCVPNLTILRKLTIGGRVYCLLTISSTRTAFAIEM